uniref:Fibronectin type-III domain-containing protein n=1 Tax=Angiostrongylus cantonensis TaxID=6313 RepID=A0A0K0CV40_ANGCA
MLCFQEISDRLVCFRVRACLTVIAFLIFPKRLAYMRHLYMMVMLQYASVAFPMLPYIQIDYAHYFRLAQCQAMCTQKYGILTSRQLLDGTSEEFLSIHNAECEACESGCHQHRRLHARGSSRVLSQNSPMHDGLRYWAASSADSAKAGSTVVLSVHLLCQNSVLDEEFGESVEGFLSISLIRPVGPTRFVVQWKQRTEMKGHYEEIRGLIPGLQYRFMVTAVGTNGRLGDTITSPWTEISNNVTPKAPEILEFSANLLRMSNGYNSDRGVIAHLQWSRTSLDSCYYKLQLSNSTFQMTTDITLDSSPSVLLPTLEFDTNYLVTIAAVSADKTQTSKSVTAHFRSLQCKDVHGHGSLQCLPEPVSDLAIVHRPNGTGVISWKPSADPQNVLFYQVVYYSLTRNTGCEMRKQVVNVKAASSFLIPVLRFYLHNACYQLKMFQTAMSAEVVFPGNECEYVVRLMNYDLIGREASAEVRIRIEPNAPVVRLNKFLQLEYLLIVVSLVIMFFTCILICFRCQRKCPVRVSEKQDRLSEYGKVDL